MNIEVFKTKISLKKDMVPLERSEAYMYGKYINNLKFKETLNFAEYVEENI